MVTSDDRRRGIAVVTVIGTLAILGGDVRTIPHAVQAARRLLAGGPLVDR